MDFEFEDFVIREVGHENRKMQTSKKVNNVSTDVTIFKVKGFDLSFDLLYCRGGKWRCLGSCGKDGVSF
ncbi:hypothetical protein [Lactococcus lactis]|uniref:hypothetical protein n=2 Tax=Lactococcus lactis TaxID=1358 RepID=UPI0024A94FD4|nr:hypothetical protein [Lactococcus lactis]